MRIRPAAWLKTTLIAAAGAAVAVIAAGRIYQLLGVRRDARRYTAPGELVQVNGTPFHLLTQGIGEPTVLLESGIAGSSLSWALVQPEIAKFTRVCSYDRAGLGWSGPCVGVRSLRRIVEDLRALLGNRTQIAGPYILVGHSFGGLVARAHAALYPSEVEALILVDPVLPREWIDAPAWRTRMLRTGISLSRRGALLAHYGVVRAALAMLTAGARRVPQFLARASSGRGADVVNRIVTEVRKLPQSMLPIIQAQWSQPKAFEGMAAHLEQLPACAAEAEEVQLPGEIRLVIISAPTATDGQKAEWDRLARSSSHGKHICSRQGGHWIPLDDPELIIDTVRELVNTARSRVSSRSANVSRVTPELKPALNEGE